jgi:hypothetical protein
LKSLLLKGDDDSNDGGDDKRVKRIELYGNIAFE